VLSRNPTTTTLATPNRARAASIARWIESDSAGTASASSRSAPALSPVEM
jgi:hypothetical protein